MSGSYTATVREDPAIARARVEFAECQREHARLSALAAKHAQRTGAAFAPTAMRTSAAVGEATIEAARRAREEVDALRRRVVDLATKALETRLRDVMPATAGRAAILWDEVAPPKPGRPRAVPAAARPDPREKDLREAAGHIKLLHDEMEAPPQLTQLVAEIAQLDDAATRGLRLLLLKNQVRAYRSYAKLLALADRLKNGELTSALAQARQQLDSGATDEGIATLKKARVQAERLKDDATEREGEEYVRRTVEAAIGMLGGSPGPDVILPDGGRLLVWPGAARPTLKVRTRRTKEGVRLELEPVILVDGDKSRPAHIAEAGAYEEAELCELLPDLEAELARQQLAIEARDLRQARKSTGAAEITRNRTKVRTSARAAQARVRQMTLPQPQRPRASGSA